MFLRKVCVSEEGVFELSLELSSHSTMQNELQQHPSVICFATRGPNERKCGPTAAAARTSYRCGPVVEGVRVCGGEYSSKNCLAAVVSPMAEF